MVSEIRELKIDELEQAAGGVSITKATDSASAKLMTSAAGGLGGPGGPPSNEKLYQQTLNLLMDAMGA